MDLSNSNPTGTESVPTPMPSAPESQAAPAVPAAAPVPAQAPAPAVKIEVAKTDKKTVGGWNRFAAHNPNAAKNKQKDGRGGPRGGRK